MIVSGLLNGKGLKGLYYARRAAGDYLCPVSSLRWFTLLSSVHYGLSRLPIRKGIEGYIYYARRAAKGFTFTVSFCPVSSLRWLTSLSLVQHMGGLNGHISGFLYGKGMKGYTMLGERQGFTFVQCLLCAGLHSVILSTIRVSDIMAIYWCCLSKTLSMSE